MDYLINLIIEAQRKIFIQGFTLGNELNISHLLFADDILLFSISEGEKLPNLFFIIKAFKQASSLKINLQKANLSGLNVGHTLILQAGSIWGYPITTLPMSYSYSSCVV